MSFEDHLSAYLTETSGNFEDEMNRLSLDRDENRPLVVSSGGSGCNSTNKILFNSKANSKLLEKSSDLATDVDGKKASKLGYYTIGGRTQQNSRQFSKYYYKQVGTFLTQYKIRENYKFLQMISVPPLDPAVPKPEGGISVPACGEPLVVPSSFPQSIEAAIHKFANASSKSTCISVIDQYGKAISSLTYGIYIYYIL